MTEPDVNSSALPELLQVEVEPVSKPTLVCTHCGGWRFVKRRKNPRGHQIYLCRVCGKHFTINPDRFTPIVNPEAEYQKEIWDIRNFGLAPNIGKYQYKLSFAGIEQPWMVEPAKRFIRFTFSTLSFSSASERLLSLKRFSRFLAQHHPTVEPESIDRALIIGYLAHLASLDFSVTTRCHSIGSLRGFLETCIQNRWVRFERYLIRHEDFPKRPKSLPRFIPNEVMSQLNHHLVDLPEPVMRMVLVLQECGMRISELLFLKPDCLLQDKAGDWFMRYYQFKMKKEITIPVSREVVRVIQEQRSYIQAALSVPFDYLFCANEGGGCKGYFTPSPKNMTQQAFSRYLNNLAKRHSICDASGKVWHFQSHQFRHSVGTTMINNGVPQHIVQRYLGHESPNMTAVYAHIFDQTMKEEIAKFQGKVVNIAGQIVDSTAPEVETPDLEWFKRNIQAQALPNGSCALPTISQGCPHANACLTCTHFRTNAQFLEEHRKQLEQTQQLIEKAEANNWTRQVEMNERIATNLRSIIKGLERSTDGD